MTPERLIELIDSQGHSDRKKYVEMEKLTGIKKETIKNLCRSHQKFNNEHLEAFAEAFPQYKMWFAFGEVYPEIGQISPALENEEGRDIAAAQ